AVRASGVVGGTAGISPAVAPGLNRVRPPAYSRVDSGPHPIDALSNRPLHGGRRRRSPRPRRAPDPSPRCGQGNGSVPRQDLAVSDPTFWTTLFATLIGAAVG